MSHFKRFLIFALSALLILAPPMAYATTSVGGWSALDVITAGATNTINATKTAGGKVLNSAVTIAPQAGKVGKHLLKGGGAAALAFAMVELADGAIDWVLDPANNAVKYKVDAVGGMDCIAQEKHYSSPQAACNVLVGASGWWGQTHAVLKNDGFFTCNRDNGAMLHGGGRCYSVAVPDEYKSISIDTVAAKVISNAEAGHADSQEAVKAVALEGFAAGEHDAALEAAATEAGTENPPDTENPPKDPDAPAEPFDPAGIISAINALKALLAGILSSITSLSDFFQSEPPAEPIPTDTEVIIDSPLDDFDSDKSYITFTGSCPPNYTASLSIMGNTVPFSFDYAPICTVMSALKPFIVGAGYLSAAYIISGVGRSTSKE